MNDLWFYTRDADSEGGNVFRIDRTLLRALQAKYPRVQVERELRKIHLHMLKRPSARWTHAGALRGIESWLKRSMGGALPRANARRIYDRLRTDYGRRFSPDDLHAWLNEWQTAFGQHHPSLIEAVLDSLGGSHPEWPPTRHEFAQLVAARAQIVPAAAPQAEPPRAPIRADVLEEMERLGRSLRAAGQGRSVQ